MHEVELRDSRGKNMSYSNDEDENNDRFDIHSSYLSDGDSITLVEDDEDEEEISCMALILGIPSKIIAFFERHPFTLVEIMIWILYYAVGILYYGSVEGWTTGQSIYFITVTMSTVGYGQYGPTSDDSRIFTAFYCIFGIMCVLTAINRWASRWLIKAQKPTLDFFLGKHTHTPSTKITFSVVIISLVLFTGLFSFALLEDWDYATSFYWTVTTMTTVGYGDLMVLHDTTRHFGVFFIYLCIFVYSLAIQNIFNSFQEVKERTMRRAAVEDVQRSGIFKKTFRSERLEEFLVEEDCAEFVLRTLLKCKQVDVVNDCEPIIKFWLQQRDMQPEAIASSKENDNRTSRSKTNRTSRTSKSTRTSMGSGNPPGMGVGVGSSTKINEHMQWQVEQFVAMRQQRVLTEKMNKRKENHVVVGKSTGRLPGRGDVGPSRGSTVNPIVHFNDEADGTVL